MRSRW